MKSSELLARGPRFVSGSTESGRMTLVRDDGTTQDAPFLMTTGVLVDNGDGTWDITFPEE